MEEQDLQISGVAFHAEGVEVAYVRLPRDVRKNGLVWQHSLMIPHGSDYDDEIETLLQALTDLLQDALDDEDRAEPIEPVDPEDEDDEEEDQ